MLILAQSNSKVHNCDDIIWKSELFENVYLREVKEKKKHFFIMQVEFDGGHALSAFDDEVELRSALFDLLCKLDPLHDVHSLRQIADSTGIHKRPEDDDE